jgi:hypothetical protein
VPRRNRRTFRYPKTDWEKLQSSRKKVSDYFANKERYDRINPEYGRRTLEDHYKLFAPFRGYTRNLF